MGPWQTCGGVVVITGLVMWVVRAAWTYFGPFGCYCEYTWAVPEYMWAWWLVGTGTGVVAAHGAVADMQWGGCGHWADGVGGKGCWDLFGPVWRLF